jgi:hypothetical protein
MLRYAVLVVAFATSYAPALALTPQERSEIVGQAEYLCRHASSVGEVLSYEGDLRVGAILRLVGGSVSGHVEQTSWSNINQIFGDYRNEPSICRMEMINILLPLFENAPVQQQGSLSSQAGPQSATAATSTPNAGFAVFAGPKSASAATATSNGADTSFSD